MIVSIGMLAWNEEQRIGSAIDSLFRQSAFLRCIDEHSVSEWEFIVIPNGCTDSTASTAAAAIEECVARQAIRQIACSVVEVDKAGKSQAWNRYVHSFSRKDATLIIMIDADIEFAHPDTLLNCIRTIRVNRFADVVVDSSLKDAARKARRTMRERISLGVSRAAMEGAPGIAGGFYCAKAEVLRKIWMPAGLSGEDGFLRAMIVTDLFRAEVDERRVVRAPDAAHWFETLTGIGEVFRHELRLVIATAQNCYLTWDFLRFATDPSGPGAGYLIRNWLDRDPDWYRKFIENAIRNRGWWVLPRGMLFRRFARLRGGRLRDRLGKVPLALFSFLFDLPVFLAANRSLKKGGGIGYW